MKGTVYLKIDLLQVYDIFAWTVVFGYTAHTGSVEMWGMDLFFTILICMVIPIFIDIFSCMTYIYIYIIV